MKYWLSPLLTLSTNLFGGFVFTGIACRCEDQLFLVLLGNIAGSQSSPTASVEAENVLEIRSLSDPVIQHFSEGRTFIGVGVGRAGITELTDDFDGVFRRPPTDIILLDREQCFLPFVRRMAVVIVMGDTGKPQSATTTSTDAKLILGLADVLC